MTTATESNNNTLDNNLRVDYVIRYSFGDLGE